MAKKGKTNKTAAKRVKFSKPKGNRKPKIKVNKDKHHNKTKMTSRAKTRSKSKKTDTVAECYEKVFVEKIKNIK
jgi:hypothetical protein